MNTNQQENWVEKIRKQYGETEKTDLDTLKELDRKVKKPAMVVACGMGTLSALVLGAGMSLIMTDIGQIFGVTEPMIPGILVGIVGLVLGILTYPVYQKVLNGRRKKYAGEILALSEKIMKP